MIQFRRVQPAIFVRGDLLVKELVVLQILIREVVLHLHSHSLIMGG